MSLDEVGYIQIISRGFRFFYILSFVSGDLHQMYYCYVILISILPYIARKCQYESMTVDDKIGVERVMKFPKAKYYGITVTAG